MKRTLQSILTAAIITGVSASLGSCDSVIYDYEGDCTVRYHVPFTFTRNILEADAFASQVTGVTLYVFDKSGNLVFSKSESGPRLAQPGYSMEVSLDPGTYDMLAWCTGTSPAANPTAFVIGSGNTMQAFTATLPLEGTSGELFVDRDITPLFHGAVSGVSCKADDYSDVILPTIDLTRDTHGVDVLLVNRDGREMTPSDFTVSITGDNSEMDCFNSLTGDKAFEYHPWSVTAAAAESKASSTSLFAEMTTGRLMVDRKPRLIITRNSDGEKVINLDLLSTLILVKGHYNSHFTDQEYFDRMDRFELTFILSDDLSWFTAGGININGWTVVPPQDQPL